MECFVFLFTTKTNTFGVISYKKDTISKQAALLFSIDNMKLVTKKLGADISSILAVTVDTSSDLVIAYSHLRMKSSTKVLIVKDATTKYFEQYDKKEIFGKEYWRD